MDVVVRPLTAEDRPVLADLLGRTPHFSPDEVLVALELLDEVLERGPATSYRALVATADGSVAGYVCFGHTPMTAHTFDLYWIVVDPERRGGGLGRRLWSACVDAVRAAGGRLVRVETSSLELYGDTLAFYDRIGLTEVARIRDFYRPGDDLVTYVWRADAA